MTAEAEMAPESAPIVACTICRDIAGFDLLVEDMETELGETWGDLTFAEALPFLRQPESESLEFIAIAVDREDESDPDLDRIAAIIAAAKQAGVRVILIAEDIGPAALHRLMRLGADDFVPYPLPEGALHESIARLGQPPARAPQPAAIPAPTGAAAPAGKGGRDGSVIAVHGMAGGVGATTLAVNLAWELANPPSTRKNPVAPPKVCLIDLDLQFGSVATYLDLPRKDVVFELLSDTAAMDAESFTQSLVSFEDRLSVLTAPPDMLPLDFITSEDANRLIDMARGQFDFVIVDMPTSVVSWTEALLNQSHVYFALMELEMRSAQNALRMLRALKAESLPTEKLRFAMNRAPKFSDFTGKSRLKRLAESLEISIDLLLPDGGRVVTEANDHGQPLGMSAAKTPLRREIQKLAQSIASVAVETRQAAA